MRPHTTLTIGSLLLALTATACSKDTDARRSEAVTAAIAVSAAPASAVTWRRGAEYAATVAALRRALPGTTLMGRVDQVLKREGDRVRAGEPLARVESRDVAARIAQAEAGVAAAQATAENARLMKERMERLTAKQAASRKNLEDATAGYDAASANVRAAEEAVKAAKVFGDYATIRAPFAGVVVERHIETGDLATPGMALFTLEDDSQVKIESALPESLASKLQAGEAIVVSVPSAIPSEHTGTLAAILPSADPKNRTFTARVILENGDGSLRPGMYARMRIEGAAAELAGAVAVPESALFRQGPLAGVFVVEERDTAGPIARLRWITAGVVHEGQVEILTGLREGERVVTGGAIGREGAAASLPSELQDGSRIEVK